VHLVGFIMRIHVRHDARSSECQIDLNSFISGSYHISRYV